ncbi:MAG: hypothetical protein HXP18_01340 [Veillonella sp.]|nr:hypothetical protein [Veillonella sp.]
MVTLTKALDLQSLKTETPAEKARQAVAQYHAQCNEDVYQSLLVIIAEESAKGAVRLSAYHCDDRKYDFVTLRNNPTAYINDAALVDINIASIVNTELLVKRLESDGFTVNTMPSDKFGLCIDIISWE